MQFQNLKPSDTNLVASKSKRSAVDYGYLQDHFIKYIVEEPQKREVIMRIGYWNRCFCFQKIFSAFLLAGNYDKSSVTHVYGSIS